MNWETYEILKKELEYKLYQTCTSAEEFEIKYRKGIQKIINLLKL